MTKPALARIKQFAHATWIALLVFLWFLYSCRLHGGSVWQRPWIALPVLGAAGLAAGAVTWMRTEKRHGILTLLALWVICCVAGVMLPIDDAPQPSLEFSASVPAVGALPGGELLRVERDGDVVEPAFVTTVPAGVDGALVTTTHWRVHANRLRIRLNHGSAIARLPVVCGAAHAWLGTESNLTDALICDEAGFSASSRVELPRLALRPSVVRIVDAFAAALVLLGLLRLMQRQPPRQSGSPNRRDAVHFACPSWIVSAFGLALFQPGLWSSDSLDQWRSAGAAVYNDWHPVLHTLGLAAVRHTVDSPLLAVALQAFAFGAASGYLIASVNAVVGGVEANWLDRGVVCGMFPVTAIMAITMWKDVAYSAAVIAMAALVVNLACGKRTSLRHPSTLLLFIGLGVATILLRHNGAPLVVSAVVLVALFRRKDIAIVSASFLVIFGVVMLFQGPISDALHVDRRHVVFALASHHVAAHVAASRATSLTNGMPSHTPVFDSLAATSRPIPYNCATVDATIFDSAFNQQKAFSDRVPLMHEWRTLAMAEPLVEIRHVVCVGSLVWRMGVLPGEPIYLKTFAVALGSDRVPRWVEPNDLGVSEGSVAPRIALPLAGLIERTWQFQIFRPAIYLFIVLVTTGLYAWRWRGGWKLVVIVSTLAFTQSLVLMVASVAQDARYQLPVYQLCACMAPIFLATLFKRRSRADPGGLAMAQDRSNVFVGGVNV